MTDNRHPGEKPDDHDHHRPVPDQRGTRSPASPSTAAPPGAHHEPDSDTRPFQLKSPATLARLPVLLGIPPTDLMLIIGSRFVRGSRSMHLGLLGHADTSVHLDPFAPDAAVARLWDGLVLKGDVADVDAVSLLAYTGRARTADLESIAAGAPFPIQELLLVNGNRWWRLDCLPTCSWQACGPRGAPLTDTLLVTDVLVSHHSRRRPSTTTGHGRVPPGALDPRNLLEPGAAARVEAVAAQLPVNPTDDLPTNQLIFRHQLGLEHDRRRRGITPGLTAPTAAVLLQGLADPLIADGCLAWADDAAWSLWTDLVAVAPSGWAAPVATLVAAMALRRDDPRTAEVALQFALHDHSGYPLAVTLNCLILPTPRERIGALLPQILDSVPVRLRSRRTPPGHTPGT